MKKVILILCGLFCAIITFAQASGGQIVRKKTTKVGVKTKAEKQLYNKHSTIPISKEQQQILDKLIANMISVEGGTFIMGATAEHEKYACDWEKPAHQVTLSSFSLNKYQVTQKECQMVMGSNPSQYKDARRPVEFVSWEDCQIFIKKLNAMTGKHFRLPTEAEWEYAARGGCKSHGYIYAGSNDFHSVFSNDIVGTTQPNELGLYDISSYVWEWCQDWYSDYSPSNQKNPIGPNTGSIRVFRGGWEGNISSSSYSRVTFRYGLSPGSKHFRIGLRLAE